MTRIHLSPADLVGVRFATSATWETVASPRAVVSLAACAADRRSSPVSRDARRALTLLGRLSRIPGWMPDALAVAPRGAAADANDLDDLVTTPEDLLDGDLETLRAKGVQPWLNLDAARYRELVHECVDTIWRERLAPRWGAVCEAYDLDLGHRMQLALWHGVGAVLNSLHPDVSLDGSVLDVRVAACTREVAAGGRGIVLVPSVFRWPNVMLSLDVPGPIVLSYPVLGAAVGWRHDRWMRTDALERLIGATRASVLRDLRRPRTTSELSARLTFAPSTISEHVAALARAHLVVARRDGKRVFYECTNLGAALLGDNLAHSQRMQLRPQDSRAR